LLGVFLHSDDDGSRFLRNVCEFLPKSSASHPIVIFRYHWLFEVERTYLRVCTQYYYDDYQIKENAIARHAACIRKINPQIILAGKPEWNNRLGTFVLGGRSVLK
jgi:hypothetical protein